MIDSDYIITDKEGNSYLLEQEQIKLKSELMKEMVRIRKSKNMTQQMIAERTGIARPNIARMENGKPKVLQSDVQKDTMPSCVAINPRKNIIVGDVQKDGMNQWTVIDYEWTVERKIPADFIIYRSLYYFIADNRREEVQALNLMEFAGITEDKQKEYDEYEKRNHLKKLIFILAYFW